MRKIMLATIAALAAGTASLTGTTPAAAYDYPYCVQGRDVGVPGDCSYRDYATCMASASGRDAYCAVNPRVAFGPLPTRRPVRPYH